MGTRARRIREPRWPYDRADFETRDIRDARDREHARAIIYDLPARPGTVR